MLAPRRILSLQSKEIGEIAYSDESPEDTTNATVRESAKKKWYVEFQINRGLSVFRKRGVFRDSVTAKKIYDKYESPQNIKENDYSIIFGEEIQSRISLFLENGTWSHFLYFDVLKEEQYPSSLPEIVLKGAGILDVFGKLTEHVILGLGWDRVHHLNKKYPKTWQYLVEMEYCQRNTNIDSPAFLAAAIRYTEYFSDELRLSGYLLRDLEVLLMDFESTFQNSQDQQYKNEVKARKKISENTIARWSSLIDALEKATTALPRGRKRKIEKLASKLIEQFRANRDVKWKGNITGQGSESILTKIRSGRGGPLLRDRLRKVEDHLENISKSK